jgi:hypothetical protein
MLKRQQITRPKDPETDSGIEYNGKKHRELEDIKECINFDLHNLKQQYS